MTDNESIHIRLDELRDLINSIHVRMDGQNAEQAIVNKEVGDLHVFVGSLVESMNAAKNASGPMGMMARNMLPPVPDFPMPPTTDLYMSPTVTVDDPADTDVEERQS